MNFFSLFRAPSSQLQRLESLRNKFFWSATGLDGKLIWTSNSELYDDYYFGGLKVGSLKGKNLAMLGKWRWRFHSKQNRLWAKVIVSHDGGFSTNTFPGGAGPWTAIVKAGLDLDDMGVPFTNSFTRKLGDGSLIKLWTDLWISLTKLCLLFPRLFALEQVQDCIVSARAVSSAQEVSWVWCWQRRP